MPGGSNDMGKESRKDVTQQAGDSHSITSIHSDILQKQAKDKLDEQVQSSGSGVQKPGYEPYIPPIGSYKEHTDTHRGYSGREDSGFRPRDIKGKKPVRENDEYSLTSSEHIEDWRSQIDFGDRARRSAGRLDAHISTAFEKLKDAEKQIKDINSKSYAPQLEPLSKRLESVHEQINVTSEAFSRSSADLDPIQRIHNQAIDRLIGKESEIPGGLGEKLKLIENRMNDFQEKQNKGELTITDMQERINLRQARGLIQERLGLQEQVVLKQSESLKRMELNVNRQQYDVEKYYESYEKAQKGGLTEKQQNLKDDIINVIEVQRDAIMAVGKKNNALLASIREISPESKDQQRQTRQIEKTTEQKNARQEALAKRSHEAELLGETVKPQALTEYIGDSLRASAANLGRRLGVVSRKSENFEARDLPARVLGAVGLDKVSRDRMLESGRAMKEGFGIWRGEKALKTEKGQERTEQKDVVRKTKDLSHKRWAGIGISRVSKGISESLIGETDSRIKELGDRIKKGEDRIEDYKRASERFVAQGRNIDKKRIDKRIEEREAKNESHQGMIDTNRQRKEKLQEIKQVYEDTYNELRANKFAVGGILIQEKMGDLLETAKHPWRTPDYQIVRSAVPTENITENLSTARQNLELLETLLTNHKSMISITKETIQESRDFASREDANGRPISATRKHNSANVNSVKLVALERYEQRIQGAVELYKVRVAALEKTDKARSEARTQPEQEKDYRDQLTREYKHYQTVRAALLTKISEQKLLSRSKFLYRTSPVSAARISALAAVERRMRKIDEKLDRSKKREKNYTRVNEEISKRMGGRTREHYDGEELEDPRRPEGFSENDFSIDEVPDFMHGERAGEAGDLRSEVNDQREQLRRSLEEERGKWVQLKEERDSIKAELGRRIAPLKSTEEMLNRINERKGKLREEQTKLESEYQDIGESALWKLLGREQIEKDRAAKSEEIERNKEVQINLAIEEKEIKESDARISSMNAEIIALAGKINSEMREIRKNARTIEKEKAEESRKDNTRTRKRSSTWGNSPFNNGVPVTIGSEGGGVSSDVNQISRDGDEA